MGRREHKLADDVIERVLAKTSPQAAARRFNWHLRNWQQDVVKRLDFYSGVVEAALPTLDPVEAERARLMWAATLEYEQATTDEERTAIDARIQPIHEVWNAAPENAPRNLIAVLMDCEGGYFSEEISAEIADLCRVPGFDEALDRWQESEEAGRRP